MADPSHLTPVATHPPGIVVEIVGTLMGDRGRSCEEHAVCGSVLEEDMVVRLRKVQVLVDGGAEETVIACYWVTDGIDRCRVGFLMRHMVKHAFLYDGALAQVTRVFNGNEEECSREERRMYHAKRGYCHATIISRLPTKKDEARATKAAAKKYRWGERDDECLINSDDERYSNKY
jgi:hypothetical protein